MRKHKVPAALAVFITLIGTFGIIGGIVAAMAPTVKSQGTELSRQAEQGINQIIDSQPRPEVIGVSPVEFWGGASAFLCGESVSCEGKAVV